MTNGENLSRADSLIIAWTPVGGTPRRLRFEPHDASGVEYERIEEERDGGEWRVVGREYVDGVAFEDGGGSA